jgi:rod shape determining protein RodA
MPIRTLSIWFPVVILAVLSVLILHSVLPEVARSQAIFFALGFGLMVAISKIDYHLYLFSPWPWLVLAIIILVLTILFGTTVRGSTRWIELGPLRLQTSEMVKPLMLLFLSVWLAQSPPVTLKDTLTKIGLALIPMFLIFIEPDLGTAMVVGALLITLLVAAGTPFRHLLAIGAICLVSMPLVYVNLHDYQKNRISSFINPGQDPLGTGYNAAQAMIAVGSGKFFGRGLGQGTQSHLRFLPERHTDFVFASTVEELGFMGGFIILAAYGWLAFGLLHAARVAQNDAGSLIILGTLGIIVTQVTVNAGMNMGILPITGITLPFLSAGGSSVLSLFILLGLCLSVARSRSHLRPTLEIH